MSHSKVYGFCESKCKVEVPSLEKHNTDISDLTNADTEINNQIAELKGNISTTVTDVVSKLIADAPEDFNTLKEIADWIDTHEDSASAMNTAILSKVDKVEGKGLSTNDYTTEEKNKLAGLSNYDDTEINNQLNNRKLYQNISTGSDNYQILKFAMNHPYKNQVISITDQYGSYIEIYGSSNEIGSDTYKKIKAIRKSYGYHLDNSIANNTDYKIRTVKFDKSTNTIYVELKSWAIIGVEGATNPISLTDTIPETATNIPLEFGIAQFDKNGNDIVNTYETKTNVKNSSAQTLYTTMVDLGFAKDELVPLEDFMLAINSKMTNSTSTIIRIGLVSANAAYVVNESKKYYINGGVLYCSKRRDLNSEWSAMDIIYTNKDNVYKFTAQRNEAGSSLIVNMYELYTDDKIAEIQKNMKIRSCLLGTGNMPPADVSNKFKSSSMTTYPSNGKYAETCLATNMSGFLTSCTSLKTVTILDTGSAQTTESMFAGCTSLTSIPELDLSNVTDAYLMFRNCSSLTSIPGTLDLRKCTRTGWMFGGCSSLTEIPRILWNESGNINMMNMFDGCSSLKEIPFIDLTKSSNIYRLFNGCASITTIPDFDYSNLTSANGLFKGCTSLKNIPNLDISNIQVVTDMFENCSSLINFPDLDLTGTTSSNGQGLDSMFKGCTSLTNLTNNPYAPAGKRWNVNKNIYFGDSPLSRESILKVFNGLQTVTSSKTITISAATNGFLTDTDRAIAKNKGWTVTVK